MATVVGTLLFEMAANVARLQSDMAKANSVVSGTMQDFRSAASLAAKALGAIGVVLSVDSFASMIRGSAEAIEHLRELGLKTGNTTEAIAALRPAVKAAGGDLDQMARGMGMLAKNMLIATDTGKGPAKAAFEELGITLTDASGKLRATADVTQEVAEKLTSMEDKTRAAALAKVILSKSGQDLLPTLEEMARLGKQDATGMNEAGEQAHQFMVRLRGLEAQSAALKREFTIGMLPALDSIAAALINTSGKSDTAREAGETFGLVMRTIAQVVYAAWEALNVFGKTIGMVAAALTALATGHPIEAVRILKDGIADIAKSAAQAAADIAKMGSAAGALPDKRGARTDTTRKTPGVGEPVPGDESDSGASFAPRAGSMGASLAAAQSLATSLRAAGDIGRETGDVLERELGLKGVRTFKSLDEVASQFVRTLLKLGIQYAASGGNKTFGVDDVLKGVFGSYAGGFASGGTINSGEWGVVGEDGPELVFGGAGGASVVPDAGMGGGDTHNYYIDARGADRTGLARLEAMIRSSNASIEYRALNAVRRQAGRRGVSMPF